MGIFDDKYQNHDFGSQAKTRKCAWTLISISRWSAADQIHDQSEARLSTESRRNELIAVLQTFRGRFYVSINVGSTIIAYLHEKIIGYYNRLN